MLSMQLAPFAVLLDIDLALDKLAVLAGPIVNAAAAGAGEFEKLVLRHREQLYSKWSAESTLRYYQMHQPHLKIHHCRFDSRAGSVSLPSQSKHSSGC
jgi:hypothetical protein